MYRNDTIAAISTPRGKGGVALIRISGANALDIASRCFSAKNGTDIAVMPPRRAVYGDILCRGGYRDSGLAIYYKSPASFTGEDTVEFMCHGGALITRRVLESVLSAGARLAEAGEFSHRALINGKLSLTEAEALSDLLSATTDAQLRIASGNTRGRLDRELEGIYNGLADTLSSLYAKIDFPDEDLADMDADGLIAAAEDVSARVDRLIFGYEGTACIREGVPSVICGLPNTGKSSLYNALAGEELAIVTDEAGTTRDVLSSELSVGNVLLRLSDTAGVRETDGKVESIGVQRALDAMEGAALLLCVFDASRPLTDEDKALARRAVSCTGKTVCVLNKCDMPQAADKAFLAELFGEVSEISAKSGVGIEALKKRIEALFLSDEIDLDGDVLLSGERQYGAAKNAKAYLDNALSALRMGMPPDCAATDMEAALGALGELDGRAVNEEIVSRVFANFCVGK
ncbi:MAG: tRNA uridine-5-carboxymethylaminomethyl(34) synthesis GTPase MnmE [Clostridia bacterium]|nr:tRNA uridine-5-carboxymethylaminomethyl(34) synthesis GTPase MnmE [Clostridia bacterium]